MRLSLERNGACGEVDDLTPYPLPLEGRGRAARWMAVGEPAVKTAPEGASRRKTRLCGLGAGEGVPVGSG